MLSVLKTKYLFENTKELILKNDCIEVSISKNTGNITSIILRDNGVLSDTCSIYLKGQAYNINAKAFLIHKQDHYPEFASIHFITQYNDKTIKHQYTIDTLALRWEVNIVNNTDSIQEVCIDFILPITKNMEKFFHGGLNKPLNLGESYETVFAYRHHLFLPVITGYSTMKNYGLSIVAPFETPKPGLLFSIDKKSFVASYRHLQLVHNKDINVAVYIIPHEGDWRPGLNFLLNKYPEYFYPAVENTRIGEGWYYLSFPFIREKKLSELHDRNVKWIELHEYFPFYGLYVPESPEWGIIIDSDEVSISSWEKGAGKKRNSYKKMENLINLWQKYGIQVYQYFQIFEAWHQYAEKYFADDIARNGEGHPLPSWKFTNLMNPDPQNQWGKHIIGQAKEILEKYPEIDGIFYDRMDYKDYDFAHSDGLTMKDNKPAYMLGFAQERINEILFNFFHKNKKGIWGNGPTSIEVCRNLDGIMAEKSLRNLYKIQYLGLARPIIYLPYDRLPHETEDKLKNALVCGAFPSTTYGGKECQNLEEKYKPLFELTRNRKWVLTPSPLEFPKDLQGNIFQTPNGDYIIVIVSPEKSQLLPRPFEYKTPVTINIANPEDIKYAYLLSGDWSGVNSLHLRKKNKSIQINIPLHLSSSLIVLTEEQKFDLARISSPVLIRGQEETLIFQTNDINPAEITIETPWFKKIKVMSNLVEFKTTIPNYLKGEVDIKIHYNGKSYVFTNWVLDPISIAPVEEIFIHDKEGEYIQFDIVNNTKTNISFNLKSNFIKGIGKIETPDKITLKSFEDKKLNLLIQPRTEGIIQLIALSKKERIISEFSVNKRFFFSKDDLFHDDFKYNMKNWKIARGKWDVSKDVAQGSGQAHFAYVKNINWQDYIYEVTTRCKGSNNSGVDWLKSYMFFRLQDERNFYRFGIHGDAGVIDLYKCVNGEWIRLCTSPFTPKKDKWYTLRVQVAGIQISGYINGVQVVEVNDNTFSSGGIGIGVLEDAQECDYKNILVKEL